MKQHVLLAYSGGLDTSVILKWLMEQGYEVSCYLADVGQNEDLDAAKAKALALGAKEVVVDDLQDVFVDDFIVPFLQTGAAYEGRYLLGTALARPLIASGLVAAARKIQATAIAHGATGKGNDQVRFELAVRQLMHEVTLIAPWRDPLFLARFQGRPDLLAYADEEGIPVDATADKSYSIDANLMHVSYEGGMLEDPSTAPDPAMFQLTVAPEQAPDMPFELTVQFEQGVPIGLSLPEGEEISGRIDVLDKLNALAGKHGIGRIDIVENRAIGIKSRGVYETPGLTVLWTAHRDLELLTLDREVYRLKEALAPKVAELIYNGLWYSPEMAFLMAAVLQSQQHVTGAVNVKLYKGNVMVTGRNSPFSLYDPAVASMDVHGGYDATDADGFIKVQALRLQAAAQQAAVGTGTPRLDPITGVG